MAVRIPKTVAAAVTVAYLSSLAGPALASGGGDGGGRGGDRPVTSSTLAPAEHHDGTTSTLELPKATSPTAPRPTDGGSGRQNVVTYLNNLAATLQANPNVDPATRDALLTRIGAARAAAQAGQPLDNATMQTLIRDVRAALGAPKGGDSHGSSTTRHAENEPNDSVTAPDGTAAAGDDGPGHEHGKDGVLRLLDTTAAKVTASSLADADKQTLLDQIAALRAKVAAGQPLGQEELGQLLTTVRTALGGTAETVGTTTSHPEDAGKKPGERALAEIDRQIAKVTSSDLPAEVKAQVLAALNEAKARIASGAAAGDDGGEAARHAIEDHRQARMEELRARLSAAADRIETRITALAADPAHQAVVDQATVELAQARDQLAAAATPDDFRAVWQQLRHIRLELRAVEQPATTTTAADPGTTDTTAPEPPATDPATTDTTAPEPPVTDPSSTDPSTTDTSAPDPTVQPAQTGSAF